LTDKQGLDFGHGDSPLYDSRKRLLLNFEFDATVDAAVACRRIGKDWTALTESLCDKAICTDSLVDEIFPHSFSAAL
jgi:hypothetical protein